MARQGPKPATEATPESTAIEAEDFEAEDFDDEADADEAAAAEHDAAHDAAMAREFSQVEAARLKRAEKAAEARQKAARLRAQREADAEAGTPPRVSKTRPSQAAAPDQAEAEPASDPVTRDDQS